MKHVRILKSKLFIFLMVLSMVLLSGLYIFQINREISDRYSIQENNKKISLISKDNKILEISLARATSLDKMTLELEPMNYEKINQISYIKVLSAQAVAK